jgi:pimeloyl-ACP methyl ester carboxylesterase
VTEALERTDGIAYRQAGPSDGPVALLVHGFPESSYMWRHLLPALAAAGWRAVAPDLPGTGDSPADPPGTWERQMEALERFRSSLGLERVALVVHDWGGLIGLRWACEHPDAVSALVISNTGFFSNGKWHGLAEAMRTEGTGEELMGDMTREALGETLRQSSSSMDDATIDEYWKGFADDERRRGHLELYRSGDFEKLAPYEGKLAELGVPALVLWGKNDPFAPVPGAYRFHKELPDSELVVVEDAGHFVFQDAPERTAEEVVGFLGRVASAA